MISSGMMGDGAWWLIRYAGESKPKGQSWRFGSSGGRGDDDYAMFGRFYLAWRGWFRGIWENIIHRGRLPIEKGTMRERTIRLAIEQVRQQQQASRTFRGRLEGKSWPRRLFGSTCSVQRRDRTEYEEEEEDNHKGRKVLWEKNTYVLRER